MIVHKSVGDIIVGLHKFAQKYHEEYNHEDTQTAKK